MALSLVKSVISNQTRKTVANVMFRAYSSQTEIPQYETLAVSEPSKHVFHVALNRPKKLNTFSHKMFLELSECFSALSENPQCRVVVLSGEGKHFTGGIDLNSFLENGSKANEFDDVARKAKILYKMIKTYQDGISALETCIKPVLAISHNACVGAGIDLITAADVRYCTEDAWFQVKEVDIGLAADVGTLQRLPKVIGNASIARELCFTARKFQSKEAKEIGLVSQVFPDRDTAIKQVLELAANIAAKSPVAVQVTKQNLVYSQSRTTKEGLMHIRLINQAMLQSEDVAKAAVAAATKAELPEFDNL
ncbi:delta(3,5)-Delta(2,4)-dienoyl-CoA isomerase, mitochondrial [Pectinophora gossypiella]|uniref:delta(3,5)-Delta(2,4)-dienoyl-CoA isomerase, mitochondrial n=1 Tax=Pectinophora gossypiella TaxID=13191 RepID=UPI00214E36E5|nr:delta(3,5)-Delta(2,4)-dienoyl-CoA isomerase, mitochondrial [Pectinophora gossypiella]